MHMDEINKIIDIEVAKIDKFNQEAVKGMLRVQIALNKSSGFKRCPQCNTWHPKYNFKNVSTRYDGLSAYCKECSNEQKRLTKES